MVNDPLEALRDRGVLYWEPLLQSDHAEVSSLAAAIEHLDDALERHSIDEASAFEMLREHSRIDNRKLVDIATAVVDGHRLLPREPQAPPHP